LKGRGEKGGREAPGRHDPRFYNNLHFFVINKKWRKRGGTRKGRGTKKIISSSSTASKDTHSPFGEKKTKKEETPLSTALPGKGEKEKKALGGERGRGRKMSGLILLSFLSSSPVGLGKKEGEGFSWEEGEMKW